MKEHAPTTEDLMLYADGELEPERAAQVEAYLEQDVYARDVVATFFEMGDRVREAADERARDAGADDIAKLVMAQIEGRRGPANVVALPAKRSAEREKPASVWPVALGGLAAAAAVALVVWRFAGLDLTEPAVTHSPVASTVSAESPELVVASAPTPAPDYDPEPGVSVDAVDFGARTGTIFYVPGDTGTTTVVWLTDDEAN